MIYNNYTIVSNTKSTDRQSAEHRSSTKKNSLKDSVLFKDIQINSVTTSYDDTAAGQHCFTLQKYYTD